MKLWRADLTAVSFWPPTFLGDLAPGHVHSGEVTGRAEEKQVGMRLRAALLPPTLTQDWGALWRGVPLGSPNAPNTLVVSMWDHRPPHKVADLARLSF